MQATTPKFVFKVGSRFLLIFKREIKTQLINRPIQLQYCKVLYMKAIYQTPLAKTHLPHTKLHHSTFHSYLVNTTYGLR